MPVEAVCLATEGSRPQELLGSSPATSRSSPRRGRTCWRWRASRRCAGCAGPGRSASASPSAPARSTPPCSSSPSAWPPPTGRAGGGPAGRVGALLLLQVAASVARLRPPAAEEAPAAPPAGGGRGGGRLGRAAVLGAGFLTVATNPLTGAFFAARHLGCLGAAPGPAALGLVVLGVFAVALGFFLAVAALLARPRARRAALAWHRPIRLGAAAALLLMSAAAFRAALG